MRRSKGLVYSCIDSCGRTFDIYADYFIPGIRDIRFESKKQIVETWKNLSYMIITYYEKNGIHVTVDFETKNLTSLSGPFACIDVHFMNAETNEYLGYATMHINL